MRALTIFYIFIFISLPSLAEYRVFTLHIVDASTQTTRQIQSTLDPEQYTSVYPLKNGEAITYVDTWRCPGRTDFFKAHCENPKRQPASISPPATATTTALPDQ